MNDRGSGCVRSRDSDELHGDCVRRQCTDGSLVGNRGPETGFGHGLCYIYRISNLGIVISCDHTKLAHAPTSHEPPLQVALTFHPHTWHMMAR